MSAWARMHVHLSPEYTQIDLTEHVGTGWIKKEGLKFCFPELKNKS